MYATTAVAKGALPGSLLSMNGGRTQHLITISSIEDDALGEKLQVDWELETEQSDIRRRYINPQARMFPVSVTYLVPERLAR